MSYVYVMTNESMPGAVKIGKANDPERRVQELTGSTSSPLPFELAHTVFVGERAYDVEQAAHKRLGKARVNPKREYFKVSPVEAYKAVCACLIEDEERYQSESKRAQALELARQALDGNLDDVKVRGAKYDDPSAKSEYLARIEAAKADNDIEALTQAIRWYTGAVMDQCRAEASTLMANHHNAMKARAENLRKKLLEDERRKQERERELQERERETLKRKKAEWELKEKKNGESQEAARAKAREDTFSLVMMAGFFGFFLVWFTEANDGNLETIFWFSGIPLTVLLLVRIAEIWKGVYR
jgi:hypothetical protein